MCFDESVEKKVGLMSHQSYKWNHIILLSFHLNSRVSHDGDRNAQTLLVVSHRDVRLRRDARRDTCLWVDGGGAVVGSRDLCGFDGAVEAHIYIIFGDASDSISHVYIDFNTADFLRFFRVPTAADGHILLGEFDDDIT